MASEYRIVDEFTDIDGEPLEVGALRDLVIIALGKTGEAHLDEAGQERFAQAYVAARHQAKANAAQAVSGG